MIIESHSETTIKLLKKLNLWPLAGYIAHCHVAMLALLVLEFIFCGGFHPSEINRLNLLFPVKCKKKWQQTWKPPPTAFRSLPVHRHGIEWMLHRIQHRRLDFHIFLPFLLWWEVSQIGHCQTIFFILSKNPISMTSPKSWAIAKTTWRHRVLLMAAMNSRRTFIPEHFEIVTSRVVTWRPFPGSSSVYAESLWFSSKWQNQH